MCRMSSASFAALLVVAVISWPVLGQEDDSPSAAPDIAAWAQLKLANGPEGRPLPLAGSWMAEDMYGPARFVEMIEDGNYVLITFLDPIHLARWTLGPNPNMERVEGKIESYYRPALEYAREHKLPIAFRGWNWEDSVGTYEQRKVRHGLPATPIEQSVRMVIDGEKSRLMDPFGPVEGWAAFGEYWGGNAAMRMVQEIYPDPPMVVFLNNNEGPRVRSAGQLPDDYPRFTAIHGEGPFTRYEKEVAIRDGYHERYEAMMSTMRETLDKPAWKKNTTFVAYNSIWGAAYIGQGNRPRRGITFDPDEGWLEWRMFDGTMPELYDNDWQPGKTDYRPWSPQTEAMNYASVLDRLFDIDPDLYWSSIVWEGGRVADVWRGRRGSSKTYHYITRGERWDFDRYEGWVQFGLWVTRPRAYREFRWPPSREHAFDQGAFQAVVNSVNRPWKNETLKRFWRFGELVPNPDESHPWALDADQPKWVKDLDRWYLLTCDANPPRNEWDNRTRIRVFSVALRLGEEPEREWLVYAHAPLGAVPMPTLQLPGYGELMLPSVPKTGSFFHVTEADRSVTPLIVGGPAEVSIEADKQWVKRGEAVTFQANIAHVYDIMKVPGFAWTFGDGATGGEAPMREVTHRFENPGSYIVTAKWDDTLSEQTVVHVGEKPDEAVVYDLPLDAPLAWEGPWDDSGEPDHELVPYRHLPNRGSAPMPVVSAGEFVRDSERGGVLRVAGGHDGVWLIRGGRTTMDKQGLPNQTISFWFKPDDVEGRQVLYASGFHGAGFNVYLDGDTLYAGSWAPAANMTASGWYPVWGRQFPGHWLTHEGIEPGTWHHVALVLENAGDAVEQDRQKLLINGEQVATGPGVRIPRQYAPPRLGRAHIGKALLTRFHDGGKEAEPFTGFLDDFRFTQSAETPRD